MNLDYQPKRVGVRKDNYIIMNRIEKAVQLAVEIHAGQVDKGGNPYILHPLRVMCTVEKWTRNFNHELREDMLCAAVLHDVIEDYDHNKYDLNEINDLIYNSCGEKCWNIVNDLTRGYREIWKDYITRIKEFSNESSTIKVADLEDNCDLSRLNRVIDSNDLSREDHYKRAIKFLEDGEGKL